MKRQIELGIFTPKIDTSQSEAYRDRFLKLKSKNKRREKLHSEAAALFHAVQVRQNYSQLSALLDTISQSLENAENKDFLLSEIRDAKGLTLLHASIQSSNSEGVEFFLEHIWNQLLQVKGERADQLFQQFINATTYQKFTALHFAVLDNNLSLLKRLVQLGGKLSLKTKLGLNLLHLAACVRNPSVIGIITYIAVNSPTQLMETDLRGQIPLHYAARNNAAVASHYLSAFMLRFCPHPKSKSNSPLILGRYCALSTQDVEGKTPLHYSVELALLHPDQTSTLRNLLILGADRRVSDKSGETPLSIAKSRPVDSRARARIQQQYLARKSYCSCCMLKMPLARISKSRKTPCFFFFLLIFTHILLFLYFDPIFGGSTVLPLNLCFCLLSVILFLVVACKNPGTLQHLQPSVFQKKVESKLAQALDQSSVFQKFCPDCLAIKSQRSRHCYVCDECVARLDHHCPWVNNCIGISNQNYFLFFMLSVFSQISWVIIQLFLLFAIQCQQIDSATFYSWIPADVREPPVCELSALVVIFMLLMFYVGVVILTFIQLTNYCQNLTTQERFSKSKPTKKAEARPIMTNRRRLSSEMSHNDEELLDKRSIHQVEQEAMKLRRSFQLKHSELNQIRERERASRGECSLRNCGYMCCGEDEVEDMSEEVFEEQESTVESQKRRHKEYEEI